MRGGGKGNGGNIEGEEGRRKDRREEEKGGERGNREDGKKQGGGREAGNLEHG